MLHNDLEEERTAVMWRLLGQYDWHTPIPLAGAPPAHNIPMAQAPPVFKRPAS